MKKANTFKVPLYKVILRLQVVTEIASGDWFVGADFRPEDVYERLYDDLQTLAAAVFASTPKSRCASTLTSISSGRTAPIR